MSRVRTWLDGRAPVPPPALLDRLHVTDEGGTLVEALAASALDHLSRARRSPGRVRDAAFHLLAADALLTWAAEAALEADDPAAELSSLARLAADRG